MENEILADGGSGGCIKMVKTIKVQKK